MTNRRSISPQARPEALPAPNPLPQVQAAALSLAKPKPRPIAPGLPPIATIADEEDYRAQQLDRLHQVSAPWTEYHVTLRREPPPPAPDGHTWLRISWTIWRLAANPPTGKSWADWDRSSPPEYIKRFADAELTPAQIARLMDVPGNVIKTPDGPKLRMAGINPQPQRVDLMTWGFPAWHLPTDFEPYDFHRQSDVIRHQAPPSEQVKASYKCADGSMDWLRFVRDKWEARLGYPEIMAFWQYLDLRARERAPGVSDAALESGIPTLRPNNVARYIAAVSTALQAKRITQEEANAMLYAAQLLIGALKALPPKQPGKPRGKQVAAQRALEAPTLIAQVIE
jgi:hypothetical protein